VDKLITAGAALLGTILGATISLWASRYAQGHQDRREKRQRVHASFCRILLAADELTAMTAPLQPRGGGAWGEPDMTDEDRRRFYETLDRLSRDLNEAVANLTLEGVGEPVAAIEELIRRFIDFRWHHNRTKQRGATEEDWTVPAEASQAIAAIRARLKVELPTILDDILPVRNGRRRSASTETGRAWVGVMHS
jgi:hypothetical protein